MKSELFPDFETVCKTSGDDLCGYAALIFAEFNSCNGFLKSAGCLLSEMPGLMVNALKWTKWAEENIASVEIRFMPELLTGYETIHRISRFARPSDGFLRNWTEFYTVRQSLLSDPYLDYSATLRYYRLKKIFPKIFSPLADRLSSKIIARYSATDFTFPSVENMRRLSCLTLAAKGDSTILLSLRSLIGRYLRWEGLTDTPEGTLAAIDLIDAASTSLSSDFSALDSVTTRIYNRLPSVSGLNRFRRDALLISTGK